MSNKKECKIINGKRLGKRKGKSCAIKSSLEDGLQSKVIKFLPLRDKTGRYISFCDYAPHQGLVLRPEVCEQRGCTHYHKLYISPENKIFTRLSLRQ